MHVYGLVPYHRILKSRTVLFKLPALFCFRNMLVSVDWKQIQKGVLEIWFYSQYKPPWRSCKKKIWIQEIVNLLPYSSCFTRSLAILWFSVWSFRNCIRGKHFCPVLKLLGPSSNVCSIFPSIHFFPSLFIVLWVRLWYCQFNFFVPVVTSHHGHCHCAALKTGIV